MDKIYSLSSNLLFSFFVFALLTNCSTQKDYITESDYSYTGNFKKYKTFQFTKIASNDSLYLKDLIEETIISKLKAQGYSFSERKPDLLITYKIFLEDFYMPGYDQPNIENWVYNDWQQKMMQDGKFVEKSLPSDMSAQYDNHEYLMNSGTLLVTFYDRRWKKTVWQGYASGLFTKQDESTERNVKLATAKIFREFRLIANGYVVKKGA